MKNIEVTYDALICENGTYEQGEAAFILPMTDELAAEYLAGRATDRGAVNLVETALEAVEVNQKAHDPQRGRHHGLGGRKADCNHLPPGAGDRRRKQAAEIPHPAGPGSRRIFYRAAEPPQPGR